MTRVPSSTSLAETVHMNREQLHRVIVISSVQYIIDSFEANARVHSTLDAWSGQICKQGKFGHEFLEFEFRPDGRVRYANNSNYKNDVMIRKETPLIIAAHLRTSADKPQGQPKKRRSLLAALPPRA
eukprot:2598250-Amphidinium_carterae.1